MERSARNDTSGIVRRSVLWTPSWYAGSFSYELIPPPPLDQADSPWIEPSGLRLSVVPPAATTFGE